MSGVEILGIAAAVLQIADLGSKVSVKLFTFARKVKNADKHIDAISKDIASTGAVLQELGLELQHDRKSVAQVSSQKLISTAQDTVNDCKRLFKSIGAAIDGEKGNKAILGFKQKLKYTYLEPEIELLRSNLDRLKSTLALMLNVLILSGQIRSHDKISKIEEQKDLIQVLRHENAQNLDRFDKLTKMLEDKPPSTTAIKTSADGPTGPRGGLDLTSASPSTSSQSSLKRALSHDDHEDIEQYQALISQVLNEIDSRQYRLARSMRNRLHEGVLDIHWEEWSPLIPIFGEEPLRRAFNALPEVIHHWTRKLRRVEGRHHDAAEKSSNSYTQSIASADRTRGILRHAITIVSQDKAFLGRSHNRNSRIPDLVVRIPTPPVAPVAPVAPAPEPDYYYERRPRRDSLHPRLSPQGSRRSSGPEEPVIIVASSRRRSRGGSGSGSSRTESAMSDQDAQTALDTARRDAFDHLSERSSGDHLSRVSSTESYQEDPISGRHHRKASGVESEEEDWERRGMRSRAEGYKAASAKPAIRRKSTIAPDTTPPGSGAASVRRESVEERSSRSARLRNATSSLSPSSPRRKSPIVIKQGASTGEWSNVDDLLKEWTNLSEQELQNDLTQRPRAKLDFHSEEE